MTNQSTNSKAMNKSLWAAQIILALLLIFGAVIKFMPIEKIAPIMPWTGEIPTLIVRILGTIDLLGAIGLILPSLVGFHPNTTPFVALCIVALMICAIVFHISRDEASSIGINIFTAIIALFIVWGRFEKMPVSRKD